VTSPAEHSTPEPSRGRGLDPVLFIVDDSPDSDGQFYLLDTTAGADYAPEQAETDSVQSSDADLA
jgi:hypothetical protein